VLRFKLFQLAAFFISAELLSEVPALSSPYGYSGVFSVDTRNSSDESRGLTGKFLVDTREFTGSTSEAESASMKLDTGGQSLSPILVQVSPTALSGLDRRQLITLYGRDFAPGASVRLTRGAESIVLTSDQIGWESPSKIRISPNLGSEGGEWSVQVLNPGGFPSIAMLLTVSPATVSPTEAVNFGVIQVGSSVQQVFTVRNLGDDALPLTADVEAPFVAVNGATAEVPPRGQIAVPVQYAPTEVGVHERTVRFHLGETVHERVVEGRATLAPIDNVASIWGNVIEQSGGLPLAGYMIDLLSNNESIGRAAVTDAMGRYEFQQVPYGPDRTYVLRLRPVSGETHGGNTSVTLNFTGGVSGNIDFLVTRSGIQAVLQEKDVPIVFVRGRGKFGKNEANTFAELRCYLASQGFTNLWDPNAEAPYLLNGETGIHANVNPLYLYIQDKIAELGFMPDRIRIVAHSMGGLIVRQLLHENYMILPVNQRIPHVSEVVMLGTPNAGSALADLGTQLNDLIDVYTFDAMEWTKSWELGWQSNRDLRTSYIRNSFEAVWPIHRFAPRLYLAAGFNPVSSGIDIDSLMYGTTSAIIYNQNPLDKWNDGAVTLLSVQGDFIPQNNLHAPALRPLLLKFKTVNDFQLRLDEIMANSLGTKNCFYGATGYIRQSETLPVDHTQIKEDPRICAWIANIFSGAPIRSLDSFPVTARCSSGVAEPIGGLAHPLENQELADAAEEEQALSPAFQLVEMLEEVVEAGGNWTHEVAVDGVDEAVFRVALNDAHMLVSIVDPAGSVWNVGNAATQAGLEFHDLGPEPDRGLQIRVADPLPGLWQLRVDASVAEEAVQVALRAYVRSDIQVLDLSRSELPSLAARGSLLWIGNPELDLELQPVLSSLSVQLQATLPEGQVETLDLIQAEPYEESDTQAQLFQGTLPGANQHGQEALVYRVQGVIQSEEGLPERPFQRVLSTSRTLAPNRGFIVGPEAFTSTDSDDDGFAEFVAVQVRVEVVEPGDFRLRGQFATADGEMLISALTPFAAEEQGSSVVTLMVSEFDLPQGMTTNGLKLRELELFQQSETDTWLDSMAPDYELPVAMFLPLGRQIRVAGELDFGTLRVGETVTREITLFNDGWDTLRLVPPALPDGVTANFPDHIDGKAEVAVQVQYSPSGETVLQESLEIDSDAQLGDGVIHVSGEVWPRGESLEEWLERHEVPESQRSPLADGSGSGMPNLLAYLFNLPTPTLTAAQQREAQPKLVIFEESGQPTLALRYRHNKAAIGVNVQVEHSDTLQGSNWGPISPIRVSTVGLDATTGDWIREVVVPKPTSDRAFWRLKVDME
jgi:hypothetical protein